MFKYLFAVLLLAVALALPICAQDAKPATPDSGGEVAPMTSFAIAVLSVVEDNDLVLQVRVMEDGQAKVIHKTTTKTGDEDGDDFVVKVVTTEVDAKLSASELKAVQEAFAKLGLEKLETKEVKEPPKKFIIIAAANGMQRARYACEFNAYGENAAKISAYVKAMEKVADRLK